MDPIAERYLRFARREAKGQSPLYEALAEHVARSPGALSFLRQLPRDRQQPNLLFAALRLVAGTPSSVDGFDQALQMHREAMERVMRTRVTQTNEPRRCAVLLPALAKLEGPLALIEVGASAGLCLLPDAYGYDWGHGRTLAPPDDLCGHAPTFRCNPCDATPLPFRHPNVVWRKGLDRSPMDLSSSEDVQWLEQLVWPEHQARLNGLRQAITVARQRKPDVLDGDLRTDLSNLISQAPSGAHVVVFHTAVLSYVQSQADRDRFADELLNSGVTWISNEAPGVFPEFAPFQSAPEPGAFLLMINAQPTAWTGPHGQWVRWLSG